MNDNQDGQRRIEEIAERLGVFRPEAYIFVLEALAGADNLEDEPDHVTGADLLESIRALGRRRYGVMAGDVFNAWGVRTTLDFGRVVFHLVDGGLLGKRDEDTLADFIDGYDFSEAFVTGGGGSRG